MKPQCGRAVHLLIQVMKPVKSPQKGINMVETVPPVHIQIQQKQLKDAREVKR